MNAGQRQLLNLLGYFFLRHGQTAKALVLLRAGGRLFPDDTAISRTLAYAELASGHPAEALAAIDRFGKSGGDVSPGSPIQVIRAKALLHLNREAEARDHFRRFIEARARAAEPAGPPLAARGGRR